MKINENYLELKQSYLFSTIAKKVREHSLSNNGEKIISCGIGDVTRPLAESVCQAMQKAVSEMGNAATFKGYGEEQGYLFLREKICKYYSERNIALDTNEVFISDGAKSDLGNILDIFSNDNSVIIPDPVYPVYCDTNIMAGRKIVFADANAENGFVPMPDPNMHGDIIYICSPNNPTGAVYSKDQLKKWVDFANENDAVILFDAAYEAFIRDKALPHSIYEIEGAKECAIEVCSFSKMAGFTGTRCGWTVVPKALKRRDTSLNALWLRRQTTKFNGVSYIIQKGAEAVFSEEGRTQIMYDVNYYLENAAILKSALNECGISSIGGDNSPYLWFGCPNGMSSWEFFDCLLENCNISGTPGVGFGRNGEGYFRFSSFSTRENTIEAAERIKKYFK